MPVLPQLAGKMLAKTVVIFQNGEPVDLSTKRIMQNSNGSLRIRQFLRQDIGVYECVVTNFAGRTSSKVFVDALTPATNGKYLIT